MAFRLARRTGRSDVTAMPLGLDTPSTFGTVFLIIGPAYQAALQRGLDPDIGGTACLVFGHRDAAWPRGFSNLRVRRCSGWIRRQVPRAGLARFVDSDCPGA